MQDVLEGLYVVVQQRKAEPQEGSYTCYLFEKGLDKILKKCGEECSEVIIAAKNGVQEERVSLNPIPQKNCSHLKHFFQTTAVLCFIIGTF